MKSCKKLIFGVFTAALIFFSLAASKEAFAVFYTVTTSAAGAGGSLSGAGTHNVNSGSTLILYIYPNTGYTAVVGGTCGGTLDITGSSYTTDPITSNCSVIVSFQLQKLTITASAGTGGTISPSGAVAVDYGKTKTFTITPDAGYTFTNIQANCGGSLTGNTYTTEPITANCTVAVAFTPPSTITASAGTGGTISPSGAVSVNYGATQSFTITPSTGYTFNNDIQANCGGSLTGNTYTTGPITANCTVAVAFTPKQYTVMASAYTGGTINSTSTTGGTISPSGAVTVNFGATQTFSVTPNTGYTISYVYSNCGGNLVGNTYTMGPVTAQCTGGQYILVEAVFVPIPYTITASAGAGGTISPSGTVTADYGTTQVFTITPNAGYSISSVTGCGGTLSGNSYTTGTISSNCAVTASFAACTVSSAIASPSAISQTITAGSNFTDVNIILKDNCGTFLSFYLDSDYSQKSSNWPSGSSLTLVSSTCCNYKTVGFNSPNWPAGTYTGSLIATPTGFAPITIPITLTVNSATGTTPSSTCTASSAVASPSSITQTTTVGTNPAATSITIKDNCGNNLAYTVNSLSYSSGSEWITTPLVGYTGTGTMTVSVNSTALTAGNYSAAIKITPAGFSEITIPVTVTINSSANATGSTTSYTVTASAGTGGTISPSGTVTATSGATQAFTVAANTGYTIASVTGCSGTLSGSTYTTGSITANCTVTATFTPTSTTAYSITASSGTGGTISPTGEVKVNSGATKVFTVTPDAGYNIVSVTGCGGTLSDNIYTTGVINSDCMVTATLSKTLGKDNCMAVLYKQNGDYYISSQILNYKDISAKTHYYWTDFVYVPTTDGELWFKLRFAGELTDITSYSACQPALLSSDLNLYMPKLIINDLSYWIDIKYVAGTGSDLMFKVLFYGLN